MSCSFGQQSLLSTAFAIDEATAGASNAMRCVLRCAVADARHVRTADADPTYFAWAVVVADWAGTLSELLDYFASICRRRRSQFRSGDNCTTKEFQ